LPDPAKPDLSNSTLVAIEESQLINFKDSKDSTLRGGVVQAGLGDEVLWAKKDFAGCQLRIVGSGSGNEVMRSLIDCCKDTCYAHK